LREVHTHSPVDFVCGEFDVFSVNIVVIVGVRDGDEDTDDEEVGDVSGDNIEGEVDDVDMVVE
jgi:hypothetical protein